MVGRYPVPVPDPALLRGLGAYRRTALEAYAIAQLLWREEGMTILRRLEEHRGMSRATRFEVWDKLIDLLDLPDLQREVRDALKERPEWPGGR